MPYEYRGPHPGITEPQVQLADGRMVSSWSNEWWVECYEREEERIRLNLPRHAIDRQTTVTQHPRFCVVTLGTKDAAYGAERGAKRQSRSEDQGRINRNGAHTLSREQQLAIHILGAQGECAAVRLMGIDGWRATVDAKKTAPDIQPDWQVRTRAKHSYDLLVRADDLDDHRFIHVTGIGPDFRIHGWMFGRDAKQEQWLTDRGGRGAPCYWVPTENLIRLQPHPKWNLDATSSRNASSSGTTIEETK